MDQETALRNLAMQNEDGKNRNKAEPSYHFMAHKAGMQQVDKEKVNAIIAEASKDSRFYHKQMEKKAKYDLSVQNAKEKIEKVKKDKQQMQSIQTRIEKKINQVEKERILSRTWVHVDMDMFFVACEIRDNPELRDKPVAVGGMDMIATANYVARQYGIRSAMPGFIAKKLCPELILIHGHSEKYRETSRKFKNIVEEYDPEYESGGLDEAVLDLTGYINEHGLNTPEEIEKVCHDMRMRINQATGITCSCGIGPNKMLAKLSTEINKPNGQYYMKPDKEEILTFLGKLPIRKIPGIGNSSEQILNGLDITICKDIMDNLFEVFVAFTENAFEFLIRSALGVSRCYHELPEERKSISVSRTFPVISKIPDMEKKVKEIANLLAEDLIHYKKKTKHLTLIIKTHNFDVKNRGAPVEKFIDDGEEIGNISLRLLKELLPLDPLRLIGIKAAQLSTEENLHTLDNLFKKAASKSSPSNATTKAAPAQQSNNLLVPPKEARMQKEYSDTTPFPGMTSRDEEESKTSVVSAVSAPPTDKPVPEKSKKESPKRLNKQRSKGEEITCPICFMKFESSVNRARINNHIDKCLAAGEGATPMPATTPAPTTSNFPNIMQPVPPPKSDTSNKISETSRSFGDFEEKKDKDIGKKRKAEDEAAMPRGNLKKNKKNTDVSDMKKLTNFFAKK